MVRYIIKRLGYAIIMVILISFVSFVIIKLPPGDFLTQKINELKARGDESALYSINSYRVRYGLDKPFLVQYWGWASKFVTGDFGESFEYQAPVADLIYERLAMTVLLAVATLVVVWAIAIPIGVFSAVHQYSIGDQIASTISFIGLGTPGFLLALLVLFFAVMVLNQDIGGLFSSKYQQAGWSFGKVVDLLKHLWVPVLISAVTDAGRLIRIMRGNLLDTLGQPFVEAARARGLKNSDVIWKHAVRIAINPLIVILGSEGLPSIISGSALVSIVLNLPTIGPLFLQALRQLDMYLAGTCIVLFTILLLLGNLLADLVLAWIDPRIRLD
ncbi:MAG: ABC transporter permease [Anaerolineaceae bacterium]